MTSDSIETDDKPCPLDSRRVDQLSPVIGAILMVAIAVILAAVFGSSLIGMRSSLKKQDIVLATSSQPSPDRIVATYYG